MSNSANVVAGAPKVLGGLAVAPLNTPLPDDASTALDAAYKRVGYITDAGVSRGTDMSVETENAWGGATVFAGQSSFGETISFSLMESKNIEALKLVYGSANVTESGTGPAKQIVVKTTAQELPEFVLVVDMVTGPTDRRLVAARAKITSREETVYVSTESIKLGLEVTLLPDANGDYMNEFIATPES